MALDMALPASSARAPLPLLPAAGVHITGRVRMRWPGWSVPSGPLLRTSRVAWAPAGTNTNAGPGSGNGTGTGTAARAENAGGALSNAMGR